MRDYKSGAPRIRVTGTITVFAGGCAHPSANQDRVHRVVQPGAEPSAELPGTVDRVYTNNDAYFSTGRPTAIVSLTNLSAYLLNITVDCAFLMDDIPVATAIGVATNVSAGSSAIEQIFTFEVVAFSSATCRVSGATR